MPKGMEGRSLEVRVTPPPDEVLKQLAKMKDGKLLQRALLSELDGVSKNAAVALRNAIRSIPNNSGKSTGLRQRMVNAVRTEAKWSGGLFATRRSTVAVILDSSKLGTQRTLPRHLDRPQGFRHPVYGNREVWVTQPGHPYFYSTLDMFRPFWTAAVRKAMEQALNESISQSNFGRAA